MSEGVWGALRSVAALLALFALEGCGPRDGRTGNLVLNPGAEDGVGSNTSAQVPIPSWTARGATAIRYGVGVFPTAEDPGPSDRGLNFFAGGDAMLSSLDQTVDVSAYAAAIDDGAVTFELSGYLGGFQDQADSTLVTLTFESGGGDALREASIGPVTATDRNNATALLPRMVHDAVPRGCRSVRVVVELTRVDAIIDAVGDNDGYADNLSLVFIGI